MNPTYDSPLLGRHKPNPRAALRLFCFPYAGGSALIYRHWGEILPRDIDVCAMHLPGRGSRLREAPFKRMTPLVEAIGREIDPLLDRPYAFFGHSMGAIISFELARLLRRRGVARPSHLFASAHRAPQIKKTAALTYNLPEAEFIEELQRLNGTPKEVLEHPELMQIIAPLLRADFESLETYAYEDEPPLDCPITALGGLHDKDVTRETLEPWREHTIAAFNLRMFPGDHFFLNADQTRLLQVVAQEAYKSLR